jgi:hypothetical protein
MSQQRQTDPNVPAKVTEVQFEPTGERELNRDPFWNDPDPHAQGRVRAPLSFSGRMFNVGWKGWTRLVIICVLVGAIFQAGGFNPFAPGFTIGQGAGQILDGIIKIATWSAQLAAMPLLLGAILVLPLWVGWRALVTLVGRDKPPGPGDRILPKERQKKPRQL